MFSLRTFAGFAGAVAIASGARYLHLRKVEQRCIKEGVGDTPVDEDQVQRASSGFLQSFVGCKKTQLVGATPEIRFYKPYQGTWCQDKQEQKPSKDQVQRASSGVLHSSDGCKKTQMVGATPEEVEQEHQTSRVPMVKNKDMKEVECEQERQDHRLLKEKYDKMKEVVQRNMGVLKSTLEHENGNLKEQVETLQGTVVKLEREIHEMQIMCEKMMNDWEEDKEQYKVLWSYCGKTMDILEHENSNLKEQVKKLQDSMRMLERQRMGTKKRRMSFATTKKSAQDDLESSALLKHENSNLMHWVHTQPVSLKELRAQLFGTCDETSKDHEQLQQDYNVLFSHYENAKASLAEAEELAVIAREFSNELEYRNTILMEQVKELHQTKETLEGQLLKNHKTRVKLVKSTLEQENTSLKEQVKTLQDSVEKLKRHLQEAYCTHEENMTDRNKGHSNSVPLCFTTKKVRRVMLKKLQEDNTQLQNENITPINDLKSLQGSTETLCPNSCKDIGDDTK